MGKDSVGETVRGGVDSSVSGAQTASPTKKGQAVGPQITPGLSDNVWSQTNLWVKRRFVGPSEQCTEPTLINQRCICYCDHANHCQRWPNVSLLAGSSQVTPFYGTFIDKENQYDTNVSVIKIKDSLWYQRIFIIKKCIKVSSLYGYMKIYLLHIRQKTCIA